MRGHQAHFHQCEVLPDTARGTCREGDERILVLDKIRTRREALWDEFVGCDEVVLVCLTVSISCIKANGGSVSGSSGVQAYHEPSHRY
jgi:hypothetical protein